MLPALHSQVLLAQAQLAEAGFAGPSWGAFLQPGADPPPSAHALDHAGPTLRGWQSPAAEAVSRQLQDEVLAQTDPASQALLFSQTGPYSSRVFTSVPSCPELAYSPALFRVLLLRRLRLPLPFAARSCRCDRLLDPLGDHRAACPRSGALRSRGCPLERAAARICREAGARVTTNTPVRDLNAPVDCLDDRRIEVTACPCGTEPSLQSTRPSCRPHA